MSVSRACMWVWFSCRVVGIRRQIKSGSLGYCCSGVMFCPGIKFSMLGLRKEERCSRRERRGEFIVDESKHCQTNGGAVMMRGGDSGELGWASFRLSYVIVDSSISMP